MLEDEIPEFGMLPSLTDLKNKLLSTNGKCFYLDQKTADMTSLTASHTLCGIKILLSFLRKNLERQVLYSLDVPPNFFQKYLQPYFDAHCSVRTF